MIFVYVISGVILFLAALLLFLTFPSGRRHEFEKKLDGLFIAHRGLFNNKNGVPENSMEAFSLAVAKGYGIETDLRLTADGEVVIFHDNTLKRMCGVDKRVDEFTLQELREFSLLDTKCRIPTLKEFLKLVDGKVFLVLEFKCDNKDCSELCSKVNEILKNYTGDYCMESFYPPAVGWYKKHRKDIMRGQLAMPYKGNNPAKKVAGMYLANCLSRPDFVAFDVRASKNIFFRLQKFLGAYPVGWTVVSAEQLGNVKNDFKAYIFEGFEP